VIITDSCVTTSTPKEEREGVKPEIFFQSIINGYYDEVKRSIDAGADVNTTDAE
jgi:hypothetical protein